MKFETGKLGLDDLNLLIELLRLRQQDENATAAQKLHAYIVENKLRTEGLK